MTAAGGCRATREGFACTRKRSHAGRHEARGLGGILLKTWAAARRVKAVAR